MRTGARSRSDEESHYLAALNLMGELSNALADLDTPHSAKPLLAQLMALCRADFDARFGSTG